MKRSTIGMIVLVLILLARCSDVLGQRGTSVNLPLSDLNSPDWQQRASAYARIGNDEEALKQSDVKKALLDLFEREGRFVNEVLVASGGELGVSVKYGEAYSEYFSSLKGTVEKIADWHDPQELCVLASAPFEPNSRFAAKLAVEGGEAGAVCLLKLAQGTTFDRRQSIPTLLQLSAVTSALSPALRQQMRQAIISGLRDPNVLVRQPTVDASDKFGTLELIPVLQEIARSDPASRPINEGREQRFVVREAAVKAIQSIQERTRIR